MYETVWRAIQMSLDTSGHGTATRASLALLSGVSEKTVARAIRIFAAENRIVCESKKGHSGGYLFGPPNRPQTGQESGQTGQQTGQKIESGNAFSQTDQAPSGTGLVGLSHSQTGQQTGHVAESPQWFVCCVWYDEKGEMWCHGRDGFDTYMACGSKEEAMELAERHSCMFHKDKGHRYGVLPRVDVCEQIGGNGGKVLHYSYGSLGRQM
jgi:hypothetical protein